MAEHTVGFALPGGLRSTAARTTSLLLEVADTGAAPLFLTEVNGLDAVALAAATAARRPGLRLGTGVLPLGSRSVPTLAMAAATIAGLSGETFHLGVGVSTPAVVEGWHGASHDPSLRTTRDRLQQLRHVIAGERRGSFSLVADPAPGRVEVLLGAMGPRMLELAYEAADGAIVNHTPPWGLEPAPPGRSLIVYIWLRAAVDAEARVRRELVSYACAPAYARHFERLGFGDDVERVARARHDRRLREAPEQLSAAFVDELYVGAHDVAARVAAVRSRGGTPVVLPVTGDDPVSDVGRALEMLRAAR